MFDALLDLFLLMSYLFELSISLVSLLFITLDLALDELVECAQLLNLLVFVVNSLDFLLQS